MDIFFEITKITKITNEPAQQEFDTINMVSTLGSFIVSIITLLFAIFIYIRWQSRHRDEKIVEIKGAIFDAVSHVGSACVILMSYYGRGSRFENKTLIDSLNTAHFNLEKEIRRFYCFTDPVGNKLDKLTHGRQFNDFLTEAKRLMHISRGLCHYASIAGFKFDGLMVEAVKPQDHYTAIIFEENIVTQNEVIPAGHINLRIVKIRDNAIEHLMHNLYK